MMTQQPMLSDPEWSLVRELLENERQNLPPEIHHTDNSDVHDQLQSRLKMVDELLRKLHDVPAA